MGELGRLGIEGHPRDASHVESRVPKTEGLAGTAQAPTVRLYFVGLSNRRRNSVTIPSWTRECVWHSSG